MATERVGRPRRRFLRFKLWPLIVRVLLFGGIIGLIGRAEQHDRATHAEMQGTGRWIGCESERWAPETRGTADPFDRRWRTDVVIYIYPSDAPCGIHFLPPRLCLMSGIWRKWFPRR